MKILPYHIPLALIRKHENKSNYAVHKLIKIIVSLACRYF